LSDEKDLASATEVQVVDYMTLETNIIPQVTHVRVYQDELLEHVAERHPEIPLLLVPSFVAAVETAITNPTHVESSLVPNKYVFVDARTANASGDPLRVPVKLVDGTSARTSTLFFASPNYETRIIWKEGS
jgi:hypothetical protein